MGTGVKTKNLTPCGREAKNHNNCLTFRSIPNCNMILLFKTFQYYFCYVSGIPIFQIFSTGSLNTNKRLLTHAVIKPSLIIRR
jgi:hypothetical protein